MEEHCDIRVWYTTYLALICSVALSSSALCMIVCFNPYLRLQLVNALYCVVFLLHIFKCHFLSLHMFMRFNQQRQLAMNLTVNFKFFKMIVCI